jgi:hypothetical protein
VHFGHISRNYAELGVSSVFTYGKFFKHFMTRLAKRFHEARRTPMTYTLGMAARATGLSKSTIHRAIKAGRVSAGRNDIGRYVIDPAELHRVFPPVQDATNSGNGSVTQDATPSEPGEVALRHARLEAEIDASLQVNALLCDQLHQTRVDRERWRGQAQQLVAAALAAPVTESGIRSRRLGFAARLMGLV